MVGVEEEVSLRIIFFIFVVLIVLFYVSYNGVILEI